MRLDQLKYLSEVAQNRSISMAAKKLQLTQPTLSTSIATLEKELGCKIFHRTAHGVVPTAHGQKVIDKANHILDEIEQLKTIFHDDMSIEGDFYLAAFPSICNIILPNVIISLKQQYPALNLYIEEEMSAHLLDILSKGKASMGITGILEDHMPIFLQRLESHRLSYREIYSDRFCAYLSSANPLAQQSSIFLEQLTQFPLVTFNDSRSGINQNDLMNYGCEFNLTFDFRERDTIKKLVAENLAISILPHTFGYEDIYVTSGVIKKLEIGDYHQKIKHILLYPSNRSLTNVELAIIDQIEAMYHTIP